MTSTELTFKVKTEVTIPVDRVRCLLVSAFEGGSNYWYMIERHVYPAGSSRKDFKEGGKHAVKDNDHVWQEHYVLPFTPGGALIISCKEEDDKKEYFLNLTSVRAGLQKMAEQYPREFADLVNENDDAETADCFLQCCLFGEAIYG